MGIATHLGPWLLGTTRYTTGTDAATTRNTGATIVSQDKAVAYNDADATTAFCLPAGSRLVSLQFITIDAFDAATTITLSLAGTAITGATTLDGTDNIILLGTALSSAGAVSAFIATNITLASAIAVTGSMLVVWTDGDGDTTISVLGHTAMASASFGSSGPITVTDLAVLEGVTPGALVAANFDFVN